MARNRNKNKQKHQEEARSPHADVNDANRVVGPSRLELLKLSLEGDSCQYVDFSALRAAEIKYFKEMRQKRVEVINCVLSAVGSNSAAAAFAAAAIAAVVATAMEYNEDPY